MSDTSSVETGEVTKRARSSTKKAVKKAAKKASKKAAPKATAKKAAPAKVSSGERRARISADATLHPLSKENPRSATGKGKGTGYDSYEIIRKKPGITYAAYIEAGGRSNDLRWDIERDWVKVKE